MTDAAKLMLSLFLSLLATSSWADSNDMNIYVNGGTATVNAGGGLFHLGRAGVTGSFYWQPGLVSKANGPVSFVFLGNQQGALDNGATGIADANSASDGNGNQVAMTHYATATVGPEADSLAQPFPGALSMNVAGCGSGGCSGYCASTTTGSTCPAFDNSTTWTSTGTLSDGSNTMLYSIGTARACCVAAIEISGIPEAYSMTWGDF